MKILQRGFSLVSAIFILVVLAGLGAAMLTFSTAQHQGSTMDVLGSRAYQAARAGIEWAAYGVIQNTAPGTLWTGCATGTTFAQNSLGGTLAPFTVSVTCSSSAITGDSISYVYTVTAVACTAAVCPGTAGGIDYIERSITTKFGK